MNPFNATLWQIAKGHLEELHREVEEQRLARRATTPASFAILGNRNFTLLWFGGLSSMMGGWMLLIALPIYVYETTGSTLATSLMFMAGTLPRILLGSVAGVFVDRWERRRTMVACNLLLILTVLPLVLVSSIEWLWLIYLVALVQSAIGQFFSPAESAFLPTVVASKQLTAANGLNALNNNLARLIGPAVGGVVMGFLGLQWVVMVAVAAYLVAAVLIASVTVTSRPAMKAVQASYGVLKAVGKVRQEWLEGLQLVMQNRVISLLFILTALTALGEGVLITLLVPFVTEVLRGEAVLYGWLMSAQVVGGLVGGVVIGWIGSRLASYRLFGLGALFMGLIDLMIFNYPAFISGATLAFVLFIVVGVPVAGFSAGLMTLVQTHVE
ncbi:MAG: MFS transporter, partial [Deinococcota bacterium]|nr:MFS transporter [Deinococcota bacterium]